MSQSPRRFVVSHHGQCVGSADLEFADTGMGVAHGRFYPEPAYQQIRAEVIRAAEARSHMPYGHAAPPRLELATRTGEIVRTGFLVVDDFEIDVDPEISASFEDREQFLRLIGGLTAAESGDPPGSA